MQKGKRGFSVRRIKGCRLTECGFQSVGFLRLESNGEDYRPDFTDSRGYFFVPPDSLTHEVAALFRRYEPIALDSITLSLEREESRSQ